MGETTAASSRLSLAVAGCIVAAALLLVQRLEPPYEVLTGSWDSMAQYESLRINVARDGPHDVVVVGSSVVQHGVEPRLLAGRLQAKLGWEPPLSAFSFGIGAHNVLTYPVLVDLVLGVDHPRLVVLVMSPRSLNASSEGLEAVAAEVTRSPYGRAALSRLRPLGALRRWTLDHVRFVGAASAFKTRLLEGTSERLKVRATGAPEYAPPRFSERPRGAYDPLLGFRPAREMPISPYLLRVGRERMGDWRTAPRYERALRQTVARIRRAGAEVLLANAPARPELLALLDDPPADLAAFREALRRASRKLDVPLVLVPQDLLPAEDFADLSHPDRAGAELWTSWLADRILETFPDLERGPS